MAMGQQDLRHLDALLGDRLLQHVEVAARVDGGAFHGFVAPDDGAVLLERGDGGDQDLEHGTDLMPPALAWKGVCWRHSCIGGNEPASSALHPGPDRPCGRSIPGPDRCRGLALRPRPGRPLRCGRCRHGRDAAGTQPWRPLVSRLAHQDDDDLHHLRGAEVRPPDAGHAGAVLRACPGDAALQARPRTRPGGDGGAGPAVAGGALGQRHGDGVRRVDLAAPRRPSPSA